MAWEANYQTLEDGYNKKKDDPDEKEFAEPAQHRFSYSDCFLNISNFLLLMFLFWVAKRNAFAVDDFTLAIAEETAQIERAANALETIASKNTASLAYELLKQNALN